MTEHVLKGSCNTTIIINNDETISVFSTDESMKVGTRRDNPNIFTFDHVRRRAHLQVWIEIKDLIDAYVPELTINTN